MPISSDQNNKECTRELNYCLHYVRTHLDWSRAIFPKNLGYLADKYYVRTKKQSLRNNTLIFYARIRKS